MLSQQIANLYRASVVTADDGEDDVSILHVSDIHLNPLGVEIVRQLATQFQVDAVLDTGDLTSFGSPVEARIGDLIAGIPVPYYLAPGNHDSPEVRQALATMPNVTVLDRSVVDIDGVRVLGVADPTFTADNRVGTAEATAEKQRQAADVARLTTARRPDVLAVHDVALAGAVAGDVPLVVSGRTATSAATSFATALASSASAPPAPPAWGRSRWPPSSTTRPRCCTSPAADLWPSTTSPSAAWAGASASTGPSSSPSSRRSRLRHRRTPSRARRATSGPPLPRARGEPPA